MYCFVSLLLVISPKLCLWNLRPSNVCTSSSNSPFGFFFILFLYQNLPIQHFTLPPKHSLCPWWQYSFVSTWNHPLGWVSKTIHNKAWCTFSTFPWSHFRLDSWLLCKAGSSGWPEQVNFSWIRKESWNLLGKFMTVV